MDPAQSGMNFYAYCKDNPLNLADPYGLCPRATVSLNHGTGWRYVHQAIVIDGIPYSFAFRDSGDRPRWVPFFYTSVWNSGYIYSEKGSDIIIESFEIPKSIADEINKEMQKLLDPETEGHYAPYAWPNWGEHGANCRSFSQTFYNTLKRYELKPNNPDKPKPDKPDKPYYFPYDPHEPYDPFNPGKLYEPFNPKILYWP